MLKGKVLCGKFTGYYYTNQSTAFLSGQSVPEDGKNIVHLYSGELKDITEAKEYNPEAYLDDNSLLFHNLGNIYLHKNANSPVKENITVSFDQAVLSNVEVLKSWEDQGKTYGLIKADFIGKIQKNIPFGSAKNTNTKGFWRSLWDFIKWILLFGLIVLLLKQCESCGAYKSRVYQDDDCCLQRDNYKHSNDSLRLLVDRLRHEKLRADSLENEIKLIELKSNLNCFAEKIYFFGNSDELRNYSSTVIDNLVLILNKYKNLKIRIEGHVNGDVPVVPDLDIKRAEKIKAMLIQKGIDASRIEAIGLKGDFPIVPREEYVTDVWGNKYNRNMRVEIKIIEF